MDLAGYVLSTVLHVLGRGAGSSNRNGGGGAGCELLSAAAERWPKDELIDESMKGELRVGGVPTVCPSDNNCVMCGWLAWQAYAMIMVGCPPLPPLSPPCHHS